MTAAESAVAHPASHDPANRNLTLRLVQAAACIAVPIAVMLAPVELPDNTRAALAIAAFMIIAWATEVMEYTAAGLVGLLLFWFFKVAEPRVIFSGFVDPASWYYMGAMLLGAIATKSGLAQAIGSFVVTRVGLTYSRLLLGLIVIDFLLTFIVPSGVARLVIMAPLCMSVIALFGVGRGSNIGRGVFIIVTYATALFDKMIIAGTGAITARGFIERVGEVDVTYSFWLLAFLPCSILTIIAGWRLTLWLFPPEVESLEGRREEILARFRMSKTMTPEVIKSAGLVTLALALWLTDSFHDIPAAMIAFGVGLLALLPFVDVLSAEDLRKANILPFFFIAAALGMSEVLRETGGLSLLTNAMMASVEPYLQDRALAVPFLYWTAFVYHFFTASEIPMLATSLPVLMEYSKSHMLDPLWVGMVWTFSAGGKLFAYQSSPLVVGYAFGYFRHSDLIKIGAALTIFEFFALAFCVAFWWPLFGF